MGRRKVEVGQRVGLGLLQHRRRPRAAPRLHVARRVVHGRHGGGVAPSRRRSTRRSTKRRPSSSGPSATRERRAGRPTAAATTPKSSSPGQERSSSACRSSAGRPSRRPPQGYDLHVGVLVCGVAASVGPSGDIEPQGIVGVH